MVLLTSFRCLARVTAAPMNDGLEGKSQKAKSPETGSSSAPSAPKWGPPAGPPPGFPPSSSPPTSRPSLQPLQSPPPYSVPEYHPVAWMPDGKASGPSPGGRREHTALPSFIRLTTCTAPLSASLNRMEPHLQFLYVHDTDFPDHDLILASDAAHCSAMTLS